MELDGTSVVPKNTFEKLHDGTIFLLYHHSEGGMHLLMDERICKEAN